MNEGAVVSMRFGIDGRQRIVRREESVGEDVRLIYPCRGRASIALEIRDDASRYSDNGRWVEVSPQQARELSALLLEFADGCDATERFEMFEYGYRPTPAE